VTVRLKIAVDETEAEVVCGLLRSEGIRCFHRPTDLTAHVAIQGPVGWREVLVNEEDLVRARESSTPAPTRSTSAPAAATSSPRTAAGIRTTRATFTRTAASARSACSVRTA
jgi:hypothetical protein